MADFTPAEAGAPARVSLAARLLSRHAAAMLWRNTVVSCSVFVVGLGVLWALVEWAGMDEVPAAALGFVTANTLHYVLGRSWIFRGTQRGRVSGYAFFLINAAIGLVLTVALYAALLELTPLNYLVARVIVSLVAGLVVFGLNAVFNFRRV